MTYAGKLRSHYYKWSQKRKGLCHSRNDSNSEPLQLTSKEDVDFVEAINAPKDSANNNPNPDGQKTEKRHPDANSPSNIENEKALRINKKPAKEQHKQNKFTSRNEPLFFQRK